jgi:hypothetical protein
MCLESSGARKSFVEFWDEEKAVNLDGDSLLVDSRLDYSAK